MRITISLLLLLFACKPSEISSKQKETMRQIYVSEFKLQYFQNLLYQGFNRSEDFKRATSIDRSNYSEILLSIDDYVIMNKKVEQDNKLMVQDSVQSIGTRAEGAEGKQVYSYALRKYQIKILDSLANARFRIYWKNELRFQKYLKTQD